MSLFVTKAEMVCKFKGKATRGRLIEHMNPEKRRHLEQFVVDYEKWKKGDDPLVAYRLKVAPLQKVFDRTHSLVGSVISVLEGWTKDAGNREEVEAETGAWHVGDTEQEDVERVQKFQAGFVRFFGADGLPPGLRKEALQKQLKAHEKAHRELPEETPKQVQTTVQADHRTLSAACDQAFDDYHDFLDGWFGSKGQEAFNQKKKFEYDRRSGYYHSTSNADAGAGEQDSTAPKNDGSTEQSAPQNVSPASNPVITGSGGSSAPAGDASATAQPAANPSAEPKA